MRAFHFYFIGFCLISWIAPSAAWALALEEFNGDFGSRSFYGKICTQEKCRYKELYRKHTAQIAVNPAEVSVSLIADEKILRTIRIPRAKLSHYEQSIGGKHEGHEALFLGPLASREEQSTDSGLKRVVEIYPYLEVRLIKYKNKQTDVDYRWGFELIESMLTRSEVTDASGAVLSRNEALTDVHEIYNQYVKDREPLKPNW